MMTRSPARYTEPKTTRRMRPNMKWSVERSSSSRWDAETIGRQSPMGVAAERNLSTDNVCAQRCGRKVGFLVRKERVFVCIWIWPVFHFVFFIFFCTLSRSTFQHEWVIAAIYQRIGTSSIPKIDTRSSLPSHEQRTSWCKPPRNIPPPQSTQSLPPQIRHVYTIVEHIASIIHVACRLRCCRRRRADRLSYSCDTLRTVHMPKVCAVN